MGTSLWADRKGRQSLNQSPVCCSMSLLASGKPFSAFFAFQRVFNAFSPQSHQFSRKNLVGTELGQVYGCVERRHGMTSMILIMVKRLFTILQSILLSVLRLHTIGTPSREYRTVGNNCTDPVHTNMYLDYFWPRAPRYLIIS